MVEVIVAFAVLLVIMAAFSRSMVMAADLTRRSEQLIGEYRILMTRSYLNEPEADRVRKVSLVFRNREGGSSFSAEARLREYESHSVRLYDVIPAGYGKTYGE